MKEETKAPAPPSLPGLFDAPTAASAPPAPVSVKTVSSAVEADKERELLAEISEGECDDDTGGRLMVAPRVGRERTFIPARIVQLTSL